MRQIPLLLLALGALHRARGRKQSVAQHDHEHDIEFQPFGLVDGGKPQPLVVGAGGLPVFGLQIGQQRELRQEILDGRKLARKDGQLFQVLQARAIVRVVNLQVLLVAGVKHELNHLPGALLNALAFQLCHGRHELRPGHRRLLGHHARTALQRHCKRPAQYCWP